MTLAAFQSLWCHNNILASATSPSGDVEDRLELHLQLSATCPVLFFCFSFPLFFWVTGELSTLRQMMKVPNEPGLSPNNGLENAFLSCNPKKKKRKKSKASSGKTTIGH